MRDKGDASVPDGPLTEAERVEKIKGLTGARVAPWRTCQKWNIAPTVRRGAKWPSGAHFAEALAQKCLGAALSKRHSPQSRFPLVFHSAPLRDCDP
jgi:hypothetical protein